MRLLTDVRIRNFRSVKEANLELGEVSSFIGTNGSGKSNVLRALNLFFNGFVEGADELDLRRDFHKPWGSVSNRFIEVEVRFQLPADRKQFAIRKNLTSPLAAIGISEGGDFWLRKRWTKDPVRENLIAVEISHRQAGAADYSILEGDGALAAERFLQLTRFRYIPNHVHPSELIRSEHAALQEVLLRAVRRALTDFDSLLGTMASATDQLVEPVSKILETAPGHFEGLEVTTPGDWAEVVWSLIPKLRTGGRGLDVALHGSGHQTALMYSLIYFLDTRFNEEFGWHQATIWAVEEPESFLHADLESWLARFLAERASRPRFQVLLTTHDLLFVAASDAGFDVSTDDFQTNVERADPMEIASRALSSGVTTFVHPLNRTAPKPTLLVDGVFDVFYLEAAYRQSGRRNPWDIRCLETLDPEVGGSGKNTLKSYLKANRGPLRARPRESPVVVLLDWEDKEAERQAFEELVAHHPTSAVIKWPEDSVNTQLGESFRGIERFLSTELVRATGLAHPGEGIVETVGAPGTYELQPAQKGLVKQRLVAECRARDDAGDLQRIINLLDWLESHLPGAITPPLPGL